MNHKFKLKFNQVVQPNPILISKLQSKQTVFINKLTKKIKNKKYSTGGLATKLKLY